MGAEKKLFLFDLDGTLLRSDKTISKKTLAEVSKLRNKGNMVIWIYHDIPVFKGL